MDYRQYEPLFGAWHIVRKIGAGSFATVYEIERREFGVTYKAALKAITIPDSPDEIQRLRLGGMDQAGIHAYFMDKVESITREVELMSKLKGNSNIVSYEDHQVIEHADKMGWDILIRMELLQPLVQVMKTRSMARRDVIQIGIDICRALELCHKFHIVHRDIKIDNIFLSENGDWKLGDFGIAKQIEQVVSNQSRKGTYPYMAPEVYRGAPYGTGVDLYSLGIVLYRLLNHNRSPFMPPYPQRMTYSDRERAFIRRMSGESFPAPDSVPEGRLAEIVLMACRYNPEDRYSSATQMREDLQAILYSGEEGEIIFPGGDRLEVQSNSYATGSSGYESAADLTQTMTETQVEQTELMDSSMPLKAVPGAAAQDSSVLRKKKRQRLVAIGSVAVALCVITVGAWQITKAQQAREAAAQQAAEQQRNEAVLEQEQRLDDTGHMTIIKQDGSVWSWGENRFGQIGNGTEQETVMPVQISTDAALISLGQAHTAMLRTDGSVWTWGDNSFGQLGNNSMSNSSSPVRVLEEADSVSAGAFHTVAVGTDGTLYVWGTDTDRLRSGGEAYITPKAVMENVKQAAAGRYFTVVLKTDGTVWTWGSNENGQLGDGTQEAQEKPVQVFDQVTQICAGKAHVLAIREDGTVWAWGAGGQGQLGTGNTDDQLRPVKVADSAAAIAAAGDQSALIRSDGVLMIWGNGISLPEKKMEGAAQIALTAHIGAALRSDGRMFTWGDNAVLELGVEGAQNHADPQQIMEQVKLLPDMTKSVKLDEEWVVEGYEAAAPYKEYERLYRNGEKTDETRYTGNTKPITPTNSGSGGSSGTYRPSGGTNYSGGGSSGGANYTPPVSNNSGGTSSSGGGSSVSSGGSSSGDTGAPDIYMGFD